MGPTKNSVTVITPCYNGARFLRETLDSALRQSCRPLEILVIDDGSTDDSAAIAESFGPLVRVIRQSNQGESVARNVGLAQARGHFVLFLDADDLLAPMALEQLLDALNPRSNSVALMGYARFRDNPDRLFEHHVPDVHAFFPKIIETNFGPPCCWLIPHALAQRVGGFAVDMNLSEDWEFVARLGLTGGELVTVPFIGAYYRQHANSQVATTPTVKKALGYAEVMARICRGLNQLPKLRAEFGQEMLWGGWTAINRCRSLGIPWSQLTVLVQQLEALVSFERRSLGRTTFGRAIRMVGYRWAVTLRQCCVGAGQNRAAVC